jgi:hypothetical protein
MLRPEALLRYNPRSSGHAEVLDQDLWVAFEEELQVSLLGSSIQRAFKGSQLVACKRSPFDELVRRERLLNTVCHSRHSRQRRSRSSRQRRAGRAPRVEEVRYCWAQRYVARMELHSTPPDRMPGSPLCGARSFGPGN